MFPFLFGFLSQSAPVFLGSFVCDPSGFLFSLLLSGSPEQQALRARPQLHPLKPFWQHIETLVTITVFLGSFLLLCSSSYFQTKENIYLFYNFIQTYHECLYYTDKGLGNGTTELKRPLISNRIIIIKIQKVSFNLTNKKCVCI